MPSSRPTSWNPSRPLSWVQPSRPTSMALSVRTRRQSTSRPNSVALDDIERIHSYHLDDASIYNSGDLELEPPSPRRSRDVPRYTIDVESASTDSSDDKEDKEIDHNGGSTMEPIKSHRKSQQPRLSQHLGEKKEEVVAKEPEPEKDPDLVTWDGPDDPANPKNWTFKRKWAATAMVSMFTVMSPISSSMVAPSLPAIGETLGIHREIELSLSLSIFVLAYAFGPLALGPMSEIFGRVPVIQIANLFYLAFNIACGFAKTPAQLIAFRFLAGLGGCAPLSCGGGVLSDMWSIDERGKAIATYSLAPLLGPAIGPIAGALISDHYSWRWVFWVTSIADVVVQVVGTFLLQETYAPKLLGVKAAKLRKSTGNENLYTQYERPKKTIAKVLRVSLVRPFRLLLTQPIVICMATYMAYLYGIMYLVLATFPTLWTVRYGQSTSRGGLNYIALGIGFFIASQGCAPINDIIYRTLKARNGGKGEPEFRVPMMVLGSLLTPAGLFWYGWSAQSKAHWAIPDVGVAIFGAGVIMCFQCIQTYLVDAYTRYAASALASASCLRSLAAFSFPLWAPHMYEALDYGWGNSTLAFVAIVLGIPAPFLLWKYGPWLRARSPYAAGGGF